MVQEDTLTFGPQTQRYCMPGLLDFFDVKVPLCLCLMRNCEGNFRTEGQKKTDVRRV